MYTGITNNLIARLYEHWQNRGQESSFAGKFYCFNLIYYETFRDVNAAIRREKEIKKWNRDKKVALIGNQNPDWVFLNAIICGEWPLKNVAGRF